MSSPAETVKLVRRPLSETLRYLASKLDEGGPGERNTALSVAVALEATADEVAAREAATKGVRVVLHDGPEYIFPAAEDFEVDLGHAYLRLTGSDGKDVAHFASGWLGVWHLGAEEGDAEDAQSRAG
ncbi:MAG TPA: hypothetical protein VGS19_23870 [Streptosporangiaceae bacterium]|nr:hypothetical protein [Streptosporangiaceae bacterium]